jgi:hypothetical protein
MINPNFAHFKQMQNNSPQFLDAYALILSLPFSCPKTLGCYQWRPIQQGVLF